MASPAATVRLRGEEPAWEPGTSAGIEPSLGAWHQCGDRTQPGILAPVAPGIEPSLGYWHQCGNRTQPGILGTSVGIEPSLGYWHQCGNRTQPGILAPLRE
ncbi:hypothetical protein DUI87_21169 [Hirundo rustica rustica]|uniref:Uncharacterized protein n=1 Tax=Hirundo rustica rustica TaxID=333673 RepID=A0A3M0K4I8_HIRRU|nr:hypothetical protein DUI87_21169 [Hirundo rustica rustica]